MRQQQQKQQDNRVCKSLTENMLVQITVSPPTTFTLLYTISIKHYTMLALSTVFLAIASKFWMSAEGIRPRLRFCSSADMLTRNVV